jgi:hypothetical protein
MRLLILDTVTALGSFLKIYAGDSEDTSPNGGTILPNYRLWQSQWFPMQRHRLFSLFMAEPGLTDLFRDIMNHDSWRYFNSTVAASVAADVRALGRLRLLQNLWSGYPYKAKSFRDPFEFTLSWDQDPSSEGEEYSVRLVRAAKGRSLALWR